MSPAKKVKWALEYAFYRTLEILLARLSIPQVSRIGAWFGLLGHRFMARRRRMVFRNLRIAFGESLSLAELRLLARRVFACTGANLLCSLRTPGISSSELEEVLEIRNLEVLHRLIARGKGVILLTPHMGNWELLAQLIYWLPDGAELGTHYRPLNNPWINNLVESQRAARGTQLFAKQGSPHALAAFLRGGGTLGILADQRTGKIGHCCSYFGRFTSCSPLPELLARRTGAGIVSITLESLTPGKWRCTFREINTASTPACMVGLEVAARTSPGDVFWFQDRWRLRKNNPLITSGKPYKGADPATSTKPVRLLVWLQPGEESIPPLPSGSRPDLSFELAGPEGIRPAAPEGFEWDEIWTTDPSLPPEQLLSVLIGIDEARQLPLDAILTINPKSSIQKAARSLSIPAVTLGPSPTS